MRDKTELTAYNPSEIEKSGIAIGKRKVIFMKPQIVQKAI